MNKRAVVVAMAVMTILAVTIAAVAFVALMDAVGYGNDPPSVIDTLKTEEGFRAKPYLDTRGYLTVGYGSRIDEELSPEETLCLGGADPHLGISERQGDCLLRVHVGEMQRCLAQGWKPWQAAVPQVKDILSLMCYELGCAGVLRFEDTLKALARRDYHAAHDFALRSLWAKEVPGRARRVVDRLLRI